MSEEQFNKLLDSLGQPNWAEKWTFILFATSILIAIVSLFYVRLQIMADHRRSQRKAASDMCMKWTEFLAPETSSVTKFIEKLTPQQVDAVANLGVLEVGKGYKAVLVDMLELKFENIDQNIDKMEENGTIKINGRELQYIRYIAVRYLNMLESILLSWSEGVADRDAIFREFSYIYDETKNFTVMEVLRKKLGENSFPAIQLFVYAVKKKRDDEISRTYRKSVIK